MKMLSKTQLLVHLKCVEDTILRMRHHVYNYGSSRCAFCRALGDSALVAVQD